MDNRFISNLEHAKKCMQLMLRDTSFVGFYYDIEFELMFYRSELPLYKGVELPRYVKLSICTVWWFYAKEDWLNRINEFPTIGVNGRSKEEALLAFELASLRCDGSASVTTIDVDEQHLTIFFDHHKQITLTSSSLCGKSWTLVEEELNGPNERWSVSCQDGQYLTRIPEAN